jgi:DNA-directed RNA polymerase specialized sigma subunit
MAHSVAVRLARRVCPRLERDEVLALADAALVEAWHCFAPDRGVRFSTYAYPWIRGAILRSGERLNQRSRREQSLVEGSIASCGTLTMILARNALARVPRRDRRMVLAHLLDERAFKDLTQGGSASTTRRRYHRALEVARG